MNWFWNDWILIGIAVAIAAIGLPLGYMGIINGELAILSLIPLFLVVFLLFWFGMVWVTRALFEGFEDLARPLPNWARFLLLGVPNWGRSQKGRDKRNDDAPN